ncbi:hypothetical protein HN446_02010 [bacterium]|jgi:hypothetical protein|nr:hypothetical protein [bacterium]
MKMNLSEKPRGFLYIIGGLALLLHTLGWIQVGLNYVIIIGALYAIVYGFFMVDGPKYIKKLLSGKKAKETPLD